MVKGFPDWYLPITLHGWDGTGVKPIKVLSTGELYAMLKCVYDSTVKDVKGDADGNLTLNLKAQDLAEIINRPKYGAAQRADVSTSVPPDTTATLINITGKGMMYGGYEETTGDDTNNLDSPQILIDGNNFFMECFSNLNSWHLGTEGGSPIVLIRYDTTQGLYGVDIKYGYTFESSCTLKYRNASGTSTAYINAALYYALV